MNKLEIREVAGDGFEVIKIIGNYRKFRINGKCTGRGPQVVRSALVQMAGEFGVNLRP